MCTVHPGHPARVRFLRRYLQFGGWGPAVPRGAPGSRGSGCDARVVWLWAAVSRVRAIKLTTRKRCINYSTTEQTNMHMHNMHVHVHVQTQTTQLLMHVHVQTQTTQLLYATP